MQRASHKHLKQRLDEAFEPSNRQATMYIYSMRFLRTNQTGSASPVVKRYEGSQGSEKSSMSAFQGKEIQDASIDYLVHKVWIKEKKSKAYGRAETMKKSESG